MSIRGARAAEDRGTQSRPLKRAEPASVTIVGAGNIGSHAISQLARLPSIESITLVDSGSYEAQNLSTQEIRSKDVGRGKASVQAERVAEIRPELSVEIMECPVEDVPLARLRASVILACVDNNRARQTINEAAMRLGRPWIDAGVRSSGLLARVNVYAPSKTGACLECAWSAADYERLEQVHPCSLELTVSSTNAPASLGSLAASLQVLECLKLLEERHDSTSAGTQLLLDAKHRKHYVTRIPRNPHCLITDHEPWKIESLPGTTEPNLGAIFDAFTSRMNGTRRAREASVVTTALPAIPQALAVYGQTFVRELFCRKCRSSHAMLRLAASSRGYSCESCGEPLVASVVTDELDRSTLSEGDLARTSTELGLRRGDVIRTVDAREVPCAFEITEVIS